MFLWLLIGFFLGYIIGHKNGWYEYSNGKQDRVRPWELPEDNLPFGYNPPAPVNERPDPPPAPPAPPLKGE